MGEAGHMWGQRVCGSPVYGLLSFAVNPNRSGKSSANCFFLSLSVMSCAAEPKPAQESGQGVELRGGDSRSANGLA